MPISSLLKALLSFLQMSQLTWSPSSSKFPTLLLNFLTAWFLQAWSRSYCCCCPTTARWRRRPDRVDAALHHCPTIALLFCVISKHMYLGWNFCSYQGVLVDVWDSSSVMNSPNLAMEMIWLSNKASVFPVNLKLCPPRPWYVHYSFLSSWFG